MPAKEEKGNFLEWSNYISESFMEPFNYVKPDNDGRVIAQACARLSAHSIDATSTNTNELQLRWQWTKFTSLSANQVYQMIALRERVFVVEQECVYLDCDGKDYESWHLLGWHPEYQDGSAEGVLVAYLRVLPPGLRYPELSIGRVVTSPDYRRQGFGRLLIQEGIRCIQETFGAVPVRIAAQSYLERFYTEMGFQKDSEEFLEDNIPHIEMFRR